MVSQVHAEHFTTDIRKLVLLWPTNILPTHIHEHAHVHHAHTCQHRKTKKPKRCMFAYRGGLEEGHELLLLVRCQKLDCVLVSEGLVEAVLEGAFGVEEEQLGFLGLAVGSHESGQSRACMCAYELYV
jgi:hypothetical protein